MDYYLHPQQESHPWSATDRDRIASACVSSILFYLYKEVAPTLCQIPLDECITLRHIIQNYMEHNYRNATLRELSQLANCAESTMSRNVQKLTGHSFTELLQQIRFEKAKVLLETTMLPISDIAIAVGYECYSFFYRRFRELYGCTPSKYRRQYNTKKIQLNAVYRTGQNCSGMQRLSFFSSPMQNRADFAIGWHLFSRPAFVI